ncbi:MAG TPA: hypothetical protein VN672_12545 [Solirubrobacteraceae bacterium]|nr:hypothetical protein [Solirubrobacteraceae bacterium]
MPPSASAKRRIAVALHDVEPALRNVLPRRFRWWAGLLGVHRRVLSAGGRSARPLLPVWGVGSASPL